MDTQLFFDAIISGGTLLWLLGIVACIIGIVIFVVTRFKKR